MCIDLVNVDGSEILYVMGADVSVYDAMGRDYQDRAAVSAYNAHYNDRRSWPRLGRSEASAFWMPRAGQGFTPRSGWPAVPM